MNDRMTVRAYGPEVLNRVQHIVRTHCRQWKEVMNVGEASGYLAVGGLEIEAAR